MSQLRSLLSAVLWLAAVVAIALGAAGGRFLTRNATGSILTRSASSSRW